MQGYKAQKKLVRKTVFQEMDKLEILNCLKVTIFQKISRE